MTALAELRIAADPDAWRSAGFALDADGVGQIGMVRLRVNPAFGQPGLRSWALAAAPKPSLSDVDGVPTDHLEPVSAPVDSTARSLGATVIDHVVLLTPDLDRTIAAVEAGLGLALLRTRDSGTYGAPMRQAFFRLGEVVLEVVGGTEPDPRGGPARFYGIAVTVTDLDAAVGRLGDRVGRPKAAVQPGRFIATIRREAGLGVPVALMTAASVGT